MKILKKIGIAIVVILLTALIGSYFYVQTLKPTYSGNLTLKQLQNTVTVNYDQFGIPHIEAATDVDAYRALGYVHAQDRLWQMELMRRIAPGRLSEIFGADLIETDKFFRTLGITQTTQKEADAFNAITNDALKANVLAYLDGINQFIDNGPTPVEFLLLGIEKTHYEVIDIYNVMGYIAFSFAEAQKSDPVATSIYHNLGEEYFHDLDMTPTGNTENIKNNPASAAISQISAKIDALLNNLPAPAWLGSNSWVVAPQKSATGGVIFANDPHMGFSQPCVWYEAHIKTPTFERYGYHAALVPFALLLHNRTYAIGLTMFENDDIDFYQESLNEAADAYAYNGNWVPLVKREETISVKDADQVTITVTQTHHGPIMNEVVGTIKTKTPLSLWWVYQQLENESMSALYQLNHGKGLDDARAGAAKIKAPGLNVMYGDVKGNIAWWASAKLHLTAEHVNRNLVLNGKDSLDEPTEWLPFEENPQAENPDWGYVYSTNNQPDTIKGGLYPGYYAPEDRANRLVEIMDGKEKLGIDDYKAMLLDHQSNIAAKIAHEFASLLEDSDKANYQEAKNLLANWQGTHTREDKAPVIYQKIIYHTLKLAMADKLDSGIFDGFINTHLMKRSLNNLFHNDSSKWWDKPQTATQETRNEIFNEAFAISIEELEAQLGNVENWQWGQVHTLEHPHPIGQVELLRDFFNVGTFNMDASDGVLNKLSFTRTASGLYPITSGPSSRRIINFADIENSYSILPTGQSGNPFSDHYRDQAEMYSQGQWRKMLMNAEEIKANSKNTLVLEP